MALNPGEYDHFFFIVVIVFMLICDIRFGIVICMHVNQLASLEYSESNEDTYLDVPKSNVTRAVFLKSRMLFFSSKFLEWAKMAKI